LSFFFPLPFSFVMTPRPPRSPLFPYTTLFRSSINDALDFMGQGRSWEHHFVLHIGAKRSEDFDAWWSAAEGQGGGFKPGGQDERSEEHTSELQSLTNLVCRLLLEKKKNRGQTMLAHILDRKIQTWCVLLNYGQCCCQRRSPSCTDSEACSMLLVCTYAQLLMTYVP